MRKLAIPIVCVVLGVIATLATGLINTTPTNLVGATWYGYPAAWLIKLVIAPQYNPWRINSVSLVMDFIFWSAVIGIISAIAMCPRCWKKPAAKRKKASRRKRA